MIDQILKMRRSSFWRRRVALGIILLAIVGCFAAAGSVVQTLLLRQRETERKNAEYTVNELLVQARRIADDYTREQLAARERTARSLAAQATASLGEMQVFLQSTAVNREARRIRGQNQELREDRAGLTGIADKQRVTIEELQQKISALEQELHSAKTSPYSSYSSSTPDATTGATEDSPIENSATRLADWEELKRELQKFSGGIKDEKFDAHWLEQLIQECALEFKNLLSPNSALLIAEVGNQVLLTLGDGSLTENEVRQEVSLPLIVQEYGDSRQLMLTLTLADIDAPPPPNPRDLARALASHLQNTGYELRGFVLDEDDNILAAFPENENGVRTLLPASNLWLTLPNGQAAAYYQTLLAPAAHRSYPWLMGLQITIPQPGSAERLSSLAAAHPLGAVVFTMACLGLIVAFMAAAILSWSGGERENEPRAHKKNSENLEPQLGSLQRLQMTNRQRENGSNVLFAAKSRALRDLTARISPTNTIRSVKNLREYQ